MSKRTVIVSGGLLEEEFALPILNSEDTEFIIGVDRGLVFLHDHDIKPDYIVGDFDSAPVILKSSTGNSSGKTEKNGPNASSLRRVIP